MPLISERELPISGDRPLPRFKYTMSTEDDERSFEFAFNGARELELDADSGWNHVDHDRYTTHASLHVAWPDGRSEQLHLTGHQHRDLEERGLHGRLLGGIAIGCSPDAVLEELLLPTLARAA